jgi:hypothetical protein
MTYIVKFIIDGDTIPYTVNAENVLDAEEAGKKAMCADVKISEKRGSEVSSWKVESIEHIPEA